MMMKHIVSPKVLLLNVIKCIISLILVAGCRRLKMMSCHEFKDQLAVAQKSFELS